MSQPNPFVAFGSKFVDSVKSGNIGAVADTLRGGIDDLVAGGRQGISDGAAWSVAAVHDVSDLARSKVSGNDPLSAVARSVINAGEGLTRFQIGASGAVLKEATSFVGTVGSLAVTAGEMYSSPTAMIDNGQSLFNSGLTATDAVSGYLNRAAADPSRILRDGQDLVSAGTKAVTDRLGGYGQAIERGEFETIGNDVGVVATYLIPAGGGPARSVLGTVGRETVEAVAESVTSSGSPFVGTPGITHPLAGFTKQDVIDMTISKGVATPRDGAVVWTNLGASGPARAEEIAQTIGGTTIGMTEGGRWLGNQNLAQVPSPFTTAEQFEIWSAVSKEFVRQASGQVRSVVGSETLSPSIYRDVELPAIRANGSITGLHQIVVGPAPPR